MVDTDGNEDEALIEECGICGGDIIIDSYCEEEDIVYCNDCEAEFLIRSVDPIRLKLLDDDIDTDVDDTDDTYDEKYD
jgi:alpha-aminoadipate carrier protein LysW